MVAASYSMGKAKRMRASSVGVPGPANYNPISASKSPAPGWRIGNSKRPNLVTNINPSPANYDVNIQSEAPQYTIMGKSRFEKIEARPGPGSYDPKPLNFSRQRSVVMAGRNNLGDQYQDLKTPGPGTYDTNISTVKDINGKIGKAERAMNNNNSISPGPGNYSLDVSSKFTPQFSFGHQQRDARSKESQFHTMGPGSYNIPSFMRTDYGFKLGSRNIYDLNKNTVPGPNQYQPNDTFCAKRYPACSIGLSNRDKTIEQMNSTVGPAQYKPNYLLTALNSSGTKIGSSKRKPLHKVDIVPGPGQYQIPFFCNNGPMFSLGTKERDNNGDILRQTQQPGPQSYRQDSIQVFQRSQSISIGSTKRDVGNNNHIPGPGQYEQKAYQVRPQQIFSRELRSQELKSQTPGPGRYDIKDQFTDELGSSQKSTLLK